jgi:hypothetical protein
MQENPPEVTEILKNRLNLQSKEKTPDLPGLKSEIDKWDTSVLKKFNK